MPSKSNAKGTSAKSQTKDVARAGASQSTDIPSGPKFEESNSRPSQDRLEAPELNQQHLKTVTQPGHDEPSREGGVNKKKQKRRMKDAAKKAAMSNDPISTTNGGKKTNGYDYDASDDDDLDQYEPDEADDTYDPHESAQQGYPGEYGSMPLQSNGHANHEEGEASGNKSKRKKKGNTGTNEASANNAIPPSGQNSFQRPPPPPPPALGRPYVPATSQHNHHTQKDSSKIWNTSTAEERERIKEFWLSLGEEERRSLVKVEKEAVLRKMKEQQKHSCSCTVCGRKRVAIEEELEVLYDAYYEELEQYANHQQVSLEDGAQILPPPKMYHPMSRQPPRAPNPYTRHRPRGRIQEIGNEEDGGDEDEDDGVEDEDDFSDEYDEAEPPTQNPAATDFFNFGNSLTVQGGILTVADDLIRNDGKKFIEMMEQLAERRMQREEDAQYAAQGLPMQHSHASNLEPDLYDEEEEDEEEDYDSAEEDEFEEEDVDTMTEEQRMEEGRRMFQIFAARMFEQRVLTAYREKVALERQQKLIEELDDETKLDAQREAKKARELQKKKDKKKQQKQAKDEEKAKRDADLAAQEAAAKALEEKKAEELRQKREEQRKKKEAEKKAQEEEKQKKEAEKQRRIQEAKDLQQEQERKVREQKERERKKKEDAKRKEREEREAKERELKEKKDRETSERKERDVTAKAQTKGEEATTVRNTTHALPMRPPPPTANTSVTTTSAPPGLGPPPLKSKPSSPHLPIATPVVPKAPTPVRARQPSYQGSRTTSPRTSIPPPLSSTTSPMLPSTIHSTTVKPNTIPPQRMTPPQPAQAQSPRSPRNVSPGFTTWPPGLSGIAAPSGLDNDPGPPETLYNAHNLTQGTPHVSTTSSGSHGISYAKGTNGMRANSHVNMPPLSMNHMPLDNYSGLGQQLPQRGSVASRTHSRNTSTSSNVGTQLNPISRPLPKQTPSSAEIFESTTHRKPENGGHLGSSALLGDPEDVPIDEPRRGSVAPLSAPQTARPAFGGTPSFPAPIGTSLPRTTHAGNGTWSNQQSPFGAAPNNAWPSTPSFSRQSTGNIFGTIGGSAPPTSVTQRANTVRTLTTSSCQKLSARSARGTNGWHSLEAVLRDVNLSKPQQVGLVDQDEILTLCEIAGNIQNGGGTFDVYSEPGMGIMIHFTPGRGLAGVPGEIGSPIGGPSGGIFSNPRPFARGPTFPSSTGF